MIFHFIPGEFFLHPPHSWKPHHHSYIFLPQSGSFPVHLIPCVFNFLRILLELISFSPPCSATLVLLLLLMDLSLCSTLLPVQYIHLSWNILCFHCTIPFHFTQNHPCLLPALMEFVVITLCFILGHGGKGVILTVQTPSVCLQLCLWD